MSVSHVGTAVDPDLGAGDGGGPGSALVLSASFIVVPRPLFIA